jgi:Family of unknown function (DUF6221)
VDDLIAFLTARLDEDERELVKDPPHGLGYANLPARMFREVEALRSIADEMARTVNGEFIDEGERVVAADVLYGLAVIWSGHPGYRPEWKP